MIHSIQLLLASFAFLLVSSACAQPSGSELLDGKETTTAVVLAHGIGAGPDGKVVGPLRKAINRELGFYTLSLQMPALPGQDFRAYAPFFPVAHQTIQAAIDYLMQEKGIKRIYLMGYSMGSRMTSSFLAEKPHPAIAGFIGVGVLQGGGEPLDANQNIRRVRIPVIDLYADSTPLDLKSAEDRRSLVSDSYKQIRVSGANHSFHGHDSFLAQEIIAWLREQELKAMGR